MENTFKQLSEEIKVKLEAQLQDEAVLKAIEQIKAASDSGTFEVVISTADVDRAGETIDQNGWDLEFYKSNPVVLWAHDYGSLPIGVTEDISVQDGKLVAKGRFAPEEANPLAQHVRRLYDLKIVRAASVGFIPREFDPNNASIITKAELLEFSLVPVPANPNALSLMKTQAISAEAMYQKGILVKENDEEEKPEDQETETHEEDKNEETEEKSIKAGRVLSEKNRALIKSTIDGLQAVSVALQELYDASESKSQGGEGEDPDNEQSPKNERSKTVGVGFEGFEESQSFHQLLRAVNTATSEVLAQYNKRGSR
jgi:HK97 family phage prohead protease